MEQKDAKCLQFDKAREMFKVADQPSVEKAAVTVKEMKGINLKPPILYQGRGTMPEGNALVFEGSGL